MILLILAILNALILGGWKSLSSIQILFLLADLDKDQFEKVVDDYNEGWFEILNNRKLPTKTKEKLIYKSFKKLCKAF